MSAESVAVLAAAFTKGCAYLAFGLAANGALRDAPDLKKLAEAIERALSKRGEQ